MIWPIMPFVATFDLPRIDEVQISRKDGEALRAKCWESRAICFVFLDEIIHHFQLPPPRDMRLILF